MTTKNPVGRPTDFNELFIEQARIIGANLGSTNVQLAAIFGVDERTIYRWQNAVPEFSQAIKDGRNDFDNNRVEASLCHRAIGYSHPDTHISNYKGQITVTPITKYYPPDTAACFIWLKNRDSGNWKDKQQIEHNGMMGVVNMTVDDYKAARGVMIDHDDC